MALSAKTRARRHRIRALLLRTAAEHLDQAGNLIARALEVYEANWSPADGVVELHREVALLQSELYSRMERELEKERSCSR